MERLGNLPEYHHPKKNLELVIGGIVEKAEVSFVSEAWVCEYENGKLIHFLPISQHSSERIHPRQLLIYVIGIVHEEDGCKLAYTEERKPDSKEYYNVWLAKVEDVADYQKVFTADELPSR